MRWNLSWLVGMAGLGALATGCAHSQSETAEATAPEPATASAPAGAGSIESAQTRAETSMTSALKAQQAAVAQQKETADEYQALDKKQDELAVAQSKAVADNERAIQKQAEANQARADALRVSEQAGTTALQAQHQDQKLMGYRTTNVDGELVDLQKDSVAIERKNGPTLYMRVGRGTVVTLDGKPAKLDSLPMGAPVHASFEPGLDIPRARRIEATTPANEESAPSDTEKSNSSTEQGSDANAPTQDNPQQ
ncbi:MAG: hypothetical protein JST54_27770 [Deltaproteobacteria bacterium]|nr:hypothetical protein [Deltaproteobacteria bacterium]